MKTLGVGEKLWATSEIDTPNVVHLDIACTFRQYSANRSLLASGVKLPWLGE